MDVIFDDTDVHCKPNALVGNFGWFLQGLLATLAFLCLISKMFLIIFINWCVYCYLLDHNNIGRYIILNKYILRYVSIFIYTCIVYTN